MSKLMRQKSKKMALSKKNFFFLERGHLMARLRRLHKYQLLRMLPCFVYYHEERFQKEKKEHETLH